MDFYQEVNTMTEKKMTAEDARRIQSQADKSGKNQDFKARAQKAAARNIKGSDKKK